jgi:hypothetical protein
MAEPFFGPAAEGEGEVAALRGKFWTPEEDTRLRMFLGAGEPLEMVAADLNRSAARRWGPCLHTPNIAQTCKAEAEGEGEMINPEERTNAVGLYNFAESYRHAADRIRASKAKPLRFDAPIRFLYYHAIELYLKACLRGDGLTPSEIKSRYGHGFKKLQKACVLRGVVFDDEDIDVIGLVDGSNYWRSRYIETGLDYYASLQGLARTSDSLARSGCDFLRSRKFIIHKPLRTPARLRR